jgi:hypothetical protein
MMRYRRKESPQKWQELHIKLMLFYYSKCLKEAEVTDAQSPTNKTGQRDRLELLYHVLCAYPSKMMGTALNGWLRRLEDEKELQRQLVNKIRMAGVSTDFGDLKNWGQKLHNGLQSLEENHSSEMFEVLSELSKEPLLEDECRAIALASQVTIPFHYKISKYTDINTWGKGSIPDVSKEIETLNQAISLVPEKCEYFVYRGVLYFFARNWDNARSDLHHALNLAQAYSNELKEPIQSLLESVIEIEESSIESEKLSRKRHEVEN